MQKFSQFYVTFRNIVQFDYKLWKLDYLKKSVLELMADPVYSLNNCKKTDFLTFPNFHLKYIVPTSPKLAFFDRI